MSDRLKLSDAKGDAEFARIAVAQELIEDQKKIKELEKNIATLEAELAKQKRSAPAMAVPTKNKIGARKQATFMAISTAPSINKTPMGPSMVPVPYPTVQDLTNSTSTAKTVNFNGSPAYLLDCSSQAGCKGDAPGTGKGVRSGTVSGEVKPIQGSKTVRIEGKRVVREGDACTMNGGNNPGVYVSQCPSGSMTPKDPFVTPDKLGAPTAGLPQNRTLELDTQNLFAPPGLTANQKLSILMQKDILDGTAFRQPLPNFAKSNSGPMLVPIDAKNGQMQHDRTRNSLTIALLGVFGGPGAAARLAGLTEEKVAAANEVAAAGMGVIWSVSGLPANSSLRPSAKSPLKILRESNSTPLVKATVGGTNNGIKVARTTSKDAFHATSTSKLAESVLKGIDAKYLNAESRFGKAFHVAEAPQTALAEMMHHGVNPTTGIRFTLNSGAMKVLDLTDPKIAALYGYKGGPITDATKAIGKAALKDGYNVIRYRSERDPSGINNAVISDFNDILKPQIATPIK